MTTEITRAMQDAIDTAPDGTSGLVCEPWSRGEVYGVAANWAQAAAPVYAYGPDGWAPSGKQVADYSHSSEDAMATEIYDACIASGDANTPEETAEAAHGIAADAVVF